jgi:Tol biopolymer transport system component
MEFTRPGTSIAITLVALSSASSGQVTTRASVATDASAGNLNSFSATITPDGRYVAFESSATNLVPADTNNMADVFVRDRVLGTTGRVSVGPNGEQANAASGAVASVVISADGRYVAFESSATNLVAGGTNGQHHVFLRDRVNGTTECVSLSSTGTEGNSYSAWPAITPDGRYVAFHSMANNLVAGDANYVADVFLRDRLTGTTELVSLSAQGLQGYQPSVAAVLSDDARYVVFISYASHFAPGHTNGTHDLYVRDRQLGTTERVSIATNGDSGTTDSDNASISADGRYVAFQSASSNFFPGDANGLNDVFVRDQMLGVTQLVSISLGGTSGNGESTRAKISADGRFVAFTSTATDLVPGDTNASVDVFVRDLRLGTTERVSVATSGAQANTGSVGDGMSSGGRYVVFESKADDLVHGGTAGIKDVFVRDLDGASFTSLCDPDVAGVIACPCANAPSGAGRGCDNSSSTGGASLSASGVAYLSMDSLVFTTSGETPTATSIVLQGTSEVTAGVVFGQGVRCAGGALKRLYTKNAVSGGITAPDFGAGDPAVSAQSAVLGDVIHAGEGRWYLVYYRDPTVLGGCPSSSTFNATQTGRVVWSL